MKEHVGHLWEIMKRLTWFILLFIYLNSPVGSDMFLFAHEIIELWKTKHLLFYNYVVRISVYRISDRTLWTSRVVGKNQGDGRHDFILWFKFGIELDLWAKFDTNQCTKKPGRLPGRRKRRKKKKRALEGLSPTTEETQTNKILIYLVYFKMLYASFQCTILHKHYFIMYIFMT